MLYLSYNQYPFNKLVNCTLVEDETKYIFTTYAIHHVFGDYGVQDKYTLIRNTWTIDKLTSVVTDKVITEIKVIYRDGHLTN
jgi:hypothetical protein